MRCSDCEEVCNGSSRQGLLLGIFWLIIWLFHQTLPMQNEQQQQKKLWSGKNLSPVIMKLQTKKTWNILVEHRGFFFQQSRETWGLALALSHYGSISEDKTLHKLIVDISCKSFHSTTLTERKSSPFTHSNTSISDWDFLSMEKGLKNVPNLPSQITL